MDDDERDEIVAPDQEEEAVPAPAADDFTEEEVEEEEALKETTDYGEEDEGEGEMEEAGDLLAEEINITDSQVMIQLKEAEEEADALRKEIKALRNTVDDYECRTNLTDQDRDKLTEIQTVLLEKTALLDEITRRIAKLMEMASKLPKDEETTVLDEEEEEGFPDDFLPKVVICSSWDDMMPKVVVCMDMKKPGIAKKKAEVDRDENGLTPEQREALEKERRCMAEERNRLQYQIACMEGEMRVMMRENDLLCKKVAQLKSEMENQPPFEFEMSVSATNPPGCGPPKPGNMEMGYGVMGPNNNGVYTVGGSVVPGSEVQGKLAVAPPPPALPPIFYAQARPPVPQVQAQQGGGRNQMPCGGVSGIPGKAVPCPRVQPQDATPPPPANDWMSKFPPYGKKCRKDFNAAQVVSRGGTNGCANCANCANAPNEGYNYCCEGNEMMPPGTPGWFNEQLIPPQLLKPPPMDVNFKVNVQPQNGPCDKKITIDSDARSNKIALQLQEIEMELKRMQKDLCKAKKDKETLKAQQATLNCAKNYIM